MSPRAERLALLGGHPVRTTPFSSKPYIDRREVDAVTEALERGLLSRFVGSPLADTREQLRQTSEELVHLDEPFSFVGGPNVRRFEAAWASAHRVSFAVAMNSATSAETSALMALDVGPGAEVITTPLSFTATATAVVAANAIPVFADIDPETMCLDPEAVERAITPRTRCIVPVHWCGNAGHFRELLDVAARHGLPILEDSAQAPGTEYEGRYLGTWGAAATFSFSEPKNVTTGEGGMVVTDDAQVAEKCRLIRNHGESVPVAEDSDEFVVNVVGQNFRMTETTAAIGWVQTSKLSTVNEIRRHNHHHLVRGLQETVGGWIVPQRLTHPDTFAAYTSAFRWIEDESGLARDTVAAALRAEGIPVATSVVRLMSDNELFRRRLAYGRSHHPFASAQVGTEIRYRPGDLPHAHRVHDREYLAFFLAGWPNTVEDMDDIVAAVAKIVAQREDLIGYQERRPAQQMTYDRGRS
jgi:dTDP-4-amino-4,6-dideoxygalactose transaminase